MAAYLAGSAYQSGARESGPRFLAPLEIMPFSVQSGCAQAGVAGAPRQRQDGGRTRWRRAGGSSAHLVAAAAQQPQPHVEHTAARIADEADERGRQTLERLELLPHIALGIEAARAAAWKADEEGAHHEREKRLRERPSA